MPQNVRIYCTFCGIFFSYRLKSYVISHFPNGNDEGWIFHGMGGGGGYVMSVLPRMIDYF